MIGETIIGWIKNRSFMDLFLVFVAYSISWSLYFYLWSNIFKKKMAWDGPLFLALLTIIFKPYLPAWAFLLLMISSQVFVGYRASKLSLLCSMSLSLYIEISTFLSDLIIIASLLHIKPFDNFIPYTSFGIAFGSLLETTFFVLGWIIYKAVKKCRTMKTRCC